MSVRRTAWVDWYVADDESAVLLGDTVVVLSALATVLIDAIGEGDAEVEELASVLQDTFGAPDGVDVVEATRAAVDTLVESGVLVSG